MNIFGEWYIGLVNIVGVLISYLVMDHDKLGYTCGPKVFVFNLIVFKT